MSAIKIRVNKQLDGFTFAILPSVREFVKTLFPGAHPANTLFISYDTASGFDMLQNGLEKQIYPMLLGVDRERLRKEVTEIEFINTETGKSEKVNL